MIRSLKPKFNRAGVWTCKTKFIVWQIVGDRLELGIAALPQPGWQRFGPVKSSCRCLHQTLARVLWLALNPERAYGELPAGWAQGNISEMVVIHCEQTAAEIGSRLDLFFWRSADDFILWLGSRFAGRIHAFERTVIESELRSLTEFAAKQKRTAQLALI